MYGGSTNLAGFNNDGYAAGAGVFKRVLWVLVNAAFFQSSIPYPMWLKKACLRLFGAKVGKGFVIKPSVTIKYPWKLFIGDYVWIGEFAWIDNLDQVIIGNHVCISQGAMLLCGNHNYKKSTFDLITGSIVLEDGAWVGAKSLVGPGVTVESHAVLSVQSVATRNLDAYTIYRGNPAIPVGRRNIV